MATQDVTKQLSGKGFGVSQGQLVRLSTGTPIQGAELTSTLQGVGVQEGDTIPGLGTFNPEGAITPPQAPQAQPVDEASITATTPEPTRMLASSTKAQKKTDQNLQVMADIETGLQVPQPKEPERPTSQEILQGKEITPEAQSELDEINQEFDQVNSLIDSRIARLDTGTAATIDGIKESFERLRKQATEQSLARQGGLNVLGFRSGRARFAPEVQIGIIGQEERRLTDVIGQLNTQESSLIQSAQNARDDKQFQLLDKRIGELRAVRAARKNVLDDLFKKTLQLENLALEQAREDRSAKQFEREGQRFEREEQQFVVDSLAPILLQLMGADEDANFELLQSVAQERGIDPNLLFGAIDNLQREDLLSVDDATTLGLPFGTTRTEAARLGVIPNVGSDIKNFEIRTVGDQVLRINKATGETSVIFESKSVSGLSPKQLTQALAIGSKITSDPVFRDMTDISTGFLGVLNGLSQQNGLGDIAAINALQRMVDPGATVRSEDVVLIQSAIAFIEQLNPAFQIKKLRDGDKLPKSTREQIRILSEQLYDVRLDSYNALSGDRFRKLVDAAGIDFDLVGGEFKPSNELIADVDRIESTTSQVTQPSGFIEKINEALTSGATSGQILKKLKETQPQFSNFITELESSGFSEQEILEGLQQKIVDDKKKIKTGMRTDRHNNPTAFTTDIAKLAGLKEGVDFETGDPFSGGRFHTARLLKDPVDTTIKVIDKISFFTQSGKQRWSHTAISRDKWKKMSQAQKIQVIKEMYRKEGNKGVLTDLFNISEALA